MSRTTQNRRKKLSRKKARRRHRLMNSEFARVFADRMHQAMMHVMKASPYEYCLFQTPKDGMTKTPTLQNQSHDAIVKDDATNDYRTQDIALCDVLAHSSDHISPGIELDFPNS